MRWLTPTVVYLCYTPVLTGEMGSPCVDVGSLVENVWLTRSGSNRHSSLAARENSMYEACIFVFWTLYFLK
jgi:hypothetical protein